MTDDDKTVNFALKAIHQLARKRNALKLFGDRIKNKDAEPDPDPDPEPSKPAISATLLKLSKLGPPAE